MSLPLQIKEACQLTTQISTDNSQLLFSTSLVQNGSLLVLPPERGLPKSLANFLQDAASYIYVIEQPPNITGTPASASASELSAAQATS